MTRKTPGGHGEPAALPGLDMPGIEGGIVELLDAARQAAAGSVKRADDGQLLGDWPPDRRSRAERQDGGLVHGEQLMARLSADLTAPTGRGFSPDNLENMRRLFAAYPFNRNFRDTVSEIWRRTAHSEFRDSVSTSISRTGPGLQVAMVGLCPTAVSQG